MSLVSLQRQAPRQGYRFTSIPVISQLSRLELISQGLSDRVNDSACQSVSKSRASPLNTRSALAHGECAILPCPRGDHPAVLLEACGSLNARLNTHTEECYMGLSDACLLSCPPCKRYLPSSVPLSPEYLPYFRWLDQDDFVKTATESTTYR